MKKMIKIFFGILALALIYVVGNILFAIATKFKPKEVEDVAVQKSEIRNQKR